MIVIVKCCPSAALVSVKRKTIKKDDGRVKGWYFVLYDAEQAFQLLEEKWACIQLHTGWKLEHCFRPLKAKERASVFVSPDAQPTTAENPALSRPQCVTSANHKSHDQTSAPLEAPTPTSPTVTSPSSPVASVSPTTSTTPIAATSPALMSPFLVN